MNNNLIIFNFDEKIQKSSLKKVDLKKTDIFHYRVANGNFAIYINNKKININVYRNKRIQSAKLKRFYKLILNFENYNKISPSFYKQTSRKFNLNDNYRDLYNISRDTYLDLAFFFIELSYKKFIFINKIDTFFDLAIAEIAQALGLTNFFSRTSVSDKVFFSKSYINKKISFENNHKLFESIPNNPWEEKSDEINKNTLKIWHSLEINEENNTKKNTNAFKKNELINIKKFLNNLKPYRGDNYIYYPLHSDPGRTTQPESGIFQDQFISILFLSKIISNKFTIIIKEHPRQLEVLEYLYHFRGIEFYKKIKKLQNVKMVPITSNIDTLINNSVAIVTGTGSTGWVGLNRGKPVILFGQPWYSECYGVININKLIDINKHINILNKNKDKILKSSKNLQNFILSKFSSAINQTNISNDMKKDSFNLSKIINKELRKR